MAESRNLMSDENQAEVKEGDLADGLAISPAEKIRSFRKHLTEQAIEDSPEYKAIVDNPKEDEDVSSDCWGALFFSIVHDLPLILDGGADFESKARCVFCLVVAITNVVIQFFLLYFITKLLMLPSMMIIQDTYQHFHEHAFDNGTFSPDQFHQLSYDDKDQICGLALSQGIFLRIILFLWLSQTIQELKDISADTWAVLTMPSLPAGLASTMMMWDPPDTEEHESYVVCLKPRTKAFLMGLIFIPKYIIALALMICGCVWLMSSATMGDLLLNSLALAFVVNIDELLGETFFPDFLKKTLENLAMKCPAKGMTAQEESEDRGKDYIYKSLFLVGVVLIAEVLIHFQPVIPGYRWDVAMACTIFVDSQTPWCLPGQADCFPVS